MGEDNAELNFFGSGMLHAPAVWAPFAIEEQTFADIAKTGLNAVRVPFGYWVVQGPGRRGLGRE